MASNRGRTAERQFAPCGTMAAYRRHRRNGETPCDACRATANAKARRKYARIGRVQQPHKHKPLPPRTCPCGATFQPDRNRKKYCDPTCPARPAYTNRRGNGGRTGAAWNRRVSELRASGNPCMHCGQPVDLELKHPHPYSFSVEHHPIPVIDLEPGHPLITDPSNTHSSHLRCNIASGNKARQARAKLPPRW